MNSDARGYDGRCYDHDLQFHSRQSSKIVVIKAAMVLTITVTTMTMLVTTMTILVMTMTIPIRATAFFHLFKSKLLRIVIGMLQIMRIMVMIMMDTI